MKIVMMSPKLLKPHPNNPRVNDQAIEAVRKSIKRFKWRQPIVIDKNGFIVVGHTRHKVALLDNLALVPVHKADDMSEAEADAYRLVDNKVGELADWDMSMLQVEVDKLMSKGFDLTGFGFTDADLGMLQEVAAVKADDNRWLQDFTTMPAAKPVWVLMKMSEDEAAPLVLELRNRQIPGAVIHYSGEPFPEK